MLTLGHFGTLLATAALPFSLIGLLYCAYGLYPNYSVRTHWISSLGETDQKSHLLFSISLGLLLLASPFLFSSTVNQFPVGISSLIVGVLLIFIGISVFGVIISPVDKKLVLHMRFAYLLFFSLISLNTILLFTHYDNLLLTAASLGSLYTSGLMLAGMWLLKKRYPQGIHNLSQIQSDNRSFVIRDITLNEWLLLLFNLTWFFVVGLTSIV